MRITIEVPDTTRCAFFNYIYTTSTGMNMGVKQIDTEDMKGGKVLVCDACHQTEKGGGDNA